MCARFTLVAPHEQLTDLFDVDFPADLSPRANIAPTKPVFIVRQGEAGREVAEVTWGLIPAWADDPSIATRMINARSETALEKPAFRAALESRRCLVPVSGFYEWADQFEPTEGGLFDDLPPVGKPVKQPYLFRSPDSRPFALAGLWERWRSPQGAVRETFTILTTSPNHLLAQIHDRMPCLLPPDLYADWLSPATPKTEAARMLIPAPDDALAQILVPRALNRATVEDMSLLDGAFR